MHSQQTDFVFRRLERAEDSSAPPLHFTFEGAPVAARRGESLATALLAAGVTDFRTNPVDGSARAPHCLMGVCFECLVEIAGVGARQACLTPVAEGMVVSRVTSPRDVTGGEGA